jgi:hypothetical protein
MICCVLEDTMTKLEREESQQHRKWQCHARERRNKLGVSDNFKPWTQLLNKALTGVPNTLRVHEMLDILWMERCQSMAPGLGMNHLVLAGPAGREHHARIAEGFVVDVSQSLARKRSTSQLGTLTQSTDAYIYSHDCMLLGSHHCQLQGIPQSWLNTGFSDREAACLAGEAFFVPCISVVILAMWTLDAPWWKAAGLSPSGMGDSQSSQVEPTLPLPTGQRGPRTPEGKRKRNPSPSAGSAASFGSASD